MGATKGLGLKFETQEANLMRRSSVEALKFIESWDLSTRISASDWIGNEAVSSLKLITKDN